MLKLSDLKKTPSGERCYRNNKQMAIRKMDVAIAESRNTPKTKGDVESELLSSELSFIVSLFFQMI